MWGISASEVLLFVIAGYFVITFLNFLVDVPVVKKSQIPGVVLTFALSCFVLIGVSADNQADTDFDIEDWLASIWEQDDYVRPVDYSLARWTLSLREIVEQAQLDLQARLDRELQIEAERTEELEFLATLQRYDMEVMRSLLYQGALPGEGAIRFMARIASHPSAMRLDIKPLTDRQILDSGPSSWALAQGVTTVVYHDIMTDTHLVMVPELAMGRSIGHSIDYDFDTRSWVISRAWKFKK